MFVKKIIRYSKIKANSIKKIVLKLIKEFDLVPKLWLTDSKFNWITINKSRRA